MTAKPICQVVDVTPTPEGFMVSVWDIENEKRYSGFSEELKLNPHHLPRVGEFIRIVPSTSNDRNTFSGFGWVEASEIDQDLLDKAPVFRGSREDFYKKHGFTPKP